MSTAMMLTDARSGIALITVSLLLAGLVCTALYVGSWRPNREDRISSQRVMLGATIVCLLLLQAAPFLAFEKGRSLFDQLSEPVMPTGLAVVIGILIALPAVGAVALMLVLRRPTPSRAGTIVVQVLAVLILALGIAESTFTMSEVSSRVVVHVGSGVALLLWIGSLLGRGWRRFALATASVLLAPSCMLAQLVIALWILPHKDPQPTPGLGATLLISGLASAIGVALALLVQPWAGRIKNRWLGGGAFVSLWLAASAIFGATVWQLDAFQALLDEAGRRRGPPFSAVFIFVGAFAAAVVVNGVGRLINEKSDTLSVQRGYRVLLISLLPALVGMGVGGCLGYVDIQRSPLEILFSKYHSTLERTTNAAFLVVPLLMTFVAAGMLRRSSTSKAWPWLARVLGAMLLAAFVAESIFLPPALAKDSSMWVAFAVVVIVLFASLWGDMWNKRYLSLAAFALAPSPFLAQFVALEYGHHEGVSNSLSIELGGLLTETSLTFAAGIGIAFVAYAGLRWGETKKSPKATDDQPSLANKWFWRTWAASTAPLLVLLGACGFGLRPALAYSPFAPKGTPSSSDSSSNRRSDAPWEAIADSTDVGSAAIRRPRTRRCDVAKSAQIYGRV